MDDIERIDWWEKEKPKFDWDAFNNMPLEQRFKEAIFKIYIPKTPWQKLPNNLI